MKTREEELVILLLPEQRQRTNPYLAVAKVDVAEDEELFAIPRSLVLMVSTSSIPPSVLAPLNETGAWPPLIVTIIYEYLRKELSPWHAYFQVLPNKFDSLMFWNADELKTLQASAVVDKIGKEGAEESWKETIIPVMLEHSDFFPVLGNTVTERTAELIKLAHMAGSLIMAYAFDIDRDEEKSGGEESGSEEFEEDDEDEPLKGMVPFADMLNADADRNNVRPKLYHPFQHSADSLLFTGPAFPGSRLLDHEIDQTNICRFPDLQRLRASPSLGPPAHVRLPYRQLRSI